MPKKPAASSAAKEKSAAKDKAVAKDKVVSFHYTVKDESGKKIESSKGEEPLTYLHGHDQIISGLEKALHGKSVGEKIEVQISPEEGYGKYNDSMVTSLKKSQFRDQKELKVGSIFQFADPEGNPVVVRVKEIKGDTIVVDGNHPFAGLTLDFNVEVVEVRAATKEELAHGHAHTGGEHC